MQNSTKDSLRKSHSLYIILCIMFCGLYFIRDNVGVHVSYYIIYTVAAITVLVCSKEEAFVFVLSLFSFQNAGYSGVFSMILLCCVFLRFYGTLLSARKSFIIVVLMCTYELFHVFCFVNATHGEYITYIASFLVLGILIQYSSECINKNFLLKSFFAFSLFFGIMTLIQMLMIFGSLEAVIENGFRNEEYRDLATKSGRLIANQNYLTVLCSINLCIGSLLVVNARNRLPYVVAILCFIFLGLLTISKMFIVILVGYALYMIYAIGKRNIKKGFCVSFLLMLFAVVGYSLFKDSLLLMVKERFLEGELTTGRIDGVKSMFNYMDNNWYTYIFGTGILNLQYVLGVAIHSSLFEIIGGWGFLGSVLPVLLVFELCKDIKKREELKKNNQALNYLPLFVMICYSFTGMLFSSASAIARLIVCIYAIGVKGEK